MGKMIAVWGSPASGKTVFSIKLAQTLYHRSRGKNAVIVVFADVRTPTIPVVFPNFKSEDVYSVGEVLSKPDINTDDVVSNMLVIHGKDTSAIWDIKRGKRYKLSRLSRSKGKKFL